MQDQQPELEWREGDVPVATRFDDPYFSLENGLAETRHVFLVATTCRPGSATGFMWPNSASAPG